MNDIPPLQLTQKQVAAEIERCEYCESKPCKQACPADCSPFDFIMAARMQEPQDFIRSAAIIMKNNPLGGICGMVCPDRHCMSECSKKLFDGSVDIPALQAYIVHRAGEMGGIPDLNDIESNGRRIAIIGAGPAGLSAAAVLGRLGYMVRIYEKKNIPGGMMNLIPSHRLDLKVLKTDIDFVLGTGDIEVLTGKDIADAGSLLDEGYEAVLVSAGLWNPILPGIEGEQNALMAADYLANPNNFDLTGNVAVIGGGATALDCAVTAGRGGARSVEMFALENIDELPLTEKERKELVEYGVGVSFRTRVMSVKWTSETVESIATVKVALKEGMDFSPAAIEDIKGTQAHRTDIDHVIIAIGSRSILPAGDSERMFFAGDCVNGPTTVVEAVASGKNAARRIDDFINNVQNGVAETDIKSSVELAGYNGVPVDLTADFFGRRISTPFLLSAAPTTDGYEQMKKAYEAGWSGGVMKTAFDGADIHIPSEYMHVFSDTTYGNCDNVSGHALDRVCSEISRLIKEYPDRLTIASTGGPVTGDDKKDMLVWQSNTRKLEESGAMGIEYSLSCPQGGDGTEGDIVSQNAALTAKIIDWIMSAGSADVPKLFKLTAAVTSIVPIMNAIAGVIGKYPGKPAGVTLANTFPVMDFRPSEKAGWDDGIVYGMSGEGVVPISYFTISRAVPVGVAVSGNGGPMNYRQAANFLALGAGTVQFCTIVMKYGYGIIDELKNGLSYFMKERGFDSVEALIKAAMPEPVVDFMDLSPVKKISDLDQELCVKCGNCTRCPYQAIEYDEEGYPRTDPEKCIGCSICAKKCFTGAIYLRERTDEETGMLKED